MDKKNNSETENARRNVAVLEIHNKQRNESYISISYMLWAAQDPNEQKTSEDSWSRSRNRPALVIKTLTKTLPRALKAGPINSRKLLRRLASSCD